MWRIPLQQNLLRKSRLLPRQAVSWWIEASAAEVDADVATVLDLLAAKVKTAPVSRS